METIEAAKNGRGPTTGALVDALHRVATIASNTFREAVRDRVLYNLVLFVLILTGAAVFIGELSGGQERKIFVDLGLSAMLLFGVTLTLPGFAGLVLTIGVAADANVVIFERIKEEVRAGKSVRAARSRWKTVPREKRSLSGP